MSVRNLDKLFKPQSVALIGATPRPGSVGAVVVRNLRRAGFAGAAAFFNMVRGHTLQGTFCDPYYGGNVGFAGWDLIGYPGVRTIATPDEQRIGADVPPNHKSAYDYEMFTNASKEKRETRPRSRSLMRGWVTPHCRAASSWVQPCFFTNSAICLINSALRRRLAACPGEAAIASQTVS